MIEDISSILPRSKTQKPTPLQKNKNSKFLQIKKTVIKSNTNKPTKKIAPYVPKMINMDDIINSNINEYVDSKTNVSISKLHILNQKNSTTKSSTSFIDIKTIKELKENNFKNSTVFDPMLFSEVERESDFKMSKSELDSFLEISNKFFRRDNKSLEESHLQNLINKKDDAVIYLPQKIMKFKGIKIKRSISIYGNSDSNLIMDKSGFNFINNNITKNIYFEEMNVKSNNVNSLFNFEDGLFNLNIQNCVFQNKGSIPTHFIKIKGDSEIKFVNIIIKNSILTNFNSFLNIESQNKIKNINIIIERCTFESFYNILNFQDNLFDNILVNISFSEFKNLDFLLKSSKNIPQKFDFSLIQNNINNYDNLITLYNGKKEFILKIINNKFIKGNNIIKLINNETSVLVQKNYFYMNYNTLFFLNNSNNINFLNNIFRKNQSEFIFHIIKSNSNFELNDFVENEYSCILLEKKKNKIKRNVKKKILFTKNNFFFNKKYDIITDSKINQYNLIFEKNNFKSDKFSLLLKLGNKLIPIFKENNFKYVIKEKLPNYIKSQKHNNKFQIISVKELPQNFKSKKKTVKIHFFHKIIDYFKK